MKSIKLITAGLLAWSLAFFAAAATVDVAGVKMQDTADVAGATLQLNGAGVRYKAVFKVYTAGLYLNKKVTTAEDALAAPGPKRIVITMLRDIDSNQLGRLFTRSVEDNMLKSDIWRVVPDLIRMGELFSKCKRMNTGDSLIIDWVPGTGTVVTVNAAGCPEKNEPFKTAEFYTALMRIWLGPKPADWKLKEQLLGQAN